jgi:hypothetical protein
MKALQKLTLIAFAVLSAGVAQAQNPCVNCAPPARPTPPAFRDPGCLTCGATANNFITVASQATRALGATDNYSNVFQNGELQYACVDQAGPGNSAVINQNAQNDPADYGNNAWTTQVNNGVGSAGRNTAYSEQTGDRNIIVQNQTGTGNQARARQGDEDFDVSYQDQTGYRNQAYSDQDGAFSQYSLQIQKGSGAYPVGHDNYSTVTQRSGSAYSATVQEGRNNTVAVYQH